MGDTCLLGFCCGFGYRGIEAERVAPVRRRRPLRKLTAEKAFRRGHNVGWYGSIAAGQHLGLPNEMRGRNLTEIDTPTEFTFWDRRLRRKLDRLMQKAHERGVIRFPSEVPVKEIERLRAALAYWIFELDGDPSWIDDEGDREVENIDLDAYLTDTPSGVEPEATS